MLELSQLEVPLTKFRSYRLTRSSDTMKIRFSQFGEVKVDHNIHSLDIDSSCEKVCEGHNSPSFTYTFSVAKG